MKCLISVPCYNCVTQVQRVLNALNKIQLSPDSEILFIDNGSTDSTVDSLLAARQQSPHQSQIQIWRNDSNYGLGGTQKVAIRYAIRNSFQWLVVLHGDDQAYVDDLLPMLKKAERNECSVLGSRFMPGSKRMGYQLKRVLGNMALNAVFTILTGKKTWDLGSGLNVFRANDLKKIKLDQISDSFNFNVDLLLAIYRQKLSHQFYPMMWRETDQTSNARNFAVASSMLKSLVRWRLGIKSQKILVSKDYTSTAL